MPKEDLLLDPVRLAAQMYRDELEYIRQQVVVPRFPKRQARLGQMPAAPIVEEVAELLEGEVA